MTGQHISVQQAYDLQQSGVELFDLREPDEWAAGIAANARTVSKAEFEQHACQYLSNFTQTALLICAGGKRSEACLESLQKRGYTNVLSVNGGTQAWQAANLPMHSYTPSDFDMRYARQLILPNVGRAGQQKLAQARVVIVGAGGLGSPCAYYLAAAGVGQLVLIDNDTVALSNLQRQILHTNARVGEKKVNSAKSTLNALNPSVSVECHDDCITTTNARNYFTNADLVIDGTDNFTARFAINDACTALDIPWIYGAVHRFDGQVSLIHSGQQHKRGPCYRCLFPQTDSDSSAPNCVEAGVLGVAPGIIGVLQATEALKYLLGIGESLQGRLLSIDLLSMRSHVAHYGIDAECDI